ncbi:NUDIX hydrolase [Bacillus sp. DNRA2]|uniref:NUDIX hydrolase n=1 Tax=Bacillus sp. DNRA2 TaxID=2723053 RepID=UPI0032B7ECA4
MIQIPSHSLAVAVYVLDDQNNILLVKGYRRGWEFPGGYVNRGESIKAAAIREVKEESGIDIVIKKTLGVEHDMYRSVSVFVFEGKKVSGDLATSSENEAVGFFSYDEAMQMIKLKNFKDRLFKCANEKNTPYIIEM